MARFKKDVQEEEGMELDTNTDVTETPAIEVKKKKLGKSFEGTIVTLTEGATGTVMNFDFNDLSAEIQAKLGPFGLGHKLGDAGAGKTGQEVVDSITKVWNGLMANDWTVRAPAAEKISKSDVKSKIAGLSEEEQGVAMALLAKLGFKL
jgi:hypothetical protein